MDLALPAQLGIDLLYIGGRRVCVVLAEKANRRAVDAACMVKGRKAAVPGRQDVYTVEDSCCLDQRVRRGQ